MRTIKERLRQLLKEEFGINYSTLELEAPGEAEPHST